MPHSGGGGSHGGGHHSGGHGGGSLGMSMPPLRRKRYPGSRRYRYFNRKGKPGYVYGKTLPKPQSTKDFLRSMIFLVPFVLVGFIMFGMTVKQMLSSKPLAPEYIAPETHIMDFADLIGDDSKLEETLADFEELTGVSPCVATVYDSVWKNNYDSLEEFAYGMYVDTFYDEQHLLIVYSEPDDADKGSFVDWSWESMLGDDIYPVVSDAKFDKMGKELQKYLCIDEMPLEEAFERTFSESMDYVMKGGFDKAQISASGLFLLIWFSFIGIFIYMFVSGFVKSKRKYEEVPFEEDSQQVSVMYCTTDDVYYDAANERYEKVPFEEDSQQMSNMYSTTDNGYYDAANERYEKVSFEEDSQQMSDMYSTTDDGYYDTANEQYDDFM